MPLNARLRTLPLSPHFSIPSCSSFGIGNAEPERAQSPTSHFYPPAANADTPFIPAQLSGNVVPVSTPNRSSTFAAASTSVGGGTAQADAEFKAQIQSLIAGNRAQQEKSNLAYAGAFGSPPTTAEAKINTLVSPNPAGMVAADSALSYVDVTAETTNGGVSGGILSPPEMVGSTSPQHSANYGRDGQSQRRQWV